jgi:hypothetical protein
MRKLSCLIAGAALLGCVSVDPGDPFDTLTTVGNENETTGDGDGDQTGDGDGDQTGDGDGDQTGDGDGDQTGDGDGDGDGDACGAFGDACNGDTCCEGLSCGADGTCGLGGGDGDGDGDPGGDPYDPATCAAPSMVLMVGELPGNFCSAPCMNNSADCPAGPVGTQAACALTTMQGADPSFCALVCSPAMDACPAGSSCKDLMDPMNPGVGLCTYP